ncbi:MAG: hypothetical protein Q8941_23485 [Bacteroidota bacterium]|nr:hypothetical protein [Bacteroidota bacterium]
MRMVTIPGFRELFPGHKGTYEEFVKDIPSEIVISVLIMLNNELNAPLPYAENQKRIRNVVSFRYSKEQLAMLNAAFSNYMQRTKGYYDDDVFGRRYLLAMILKELNNFRSFELADTSPQYEFNILMAYLCIVQEVNDKDHALMPDPKENAKDPLGMYRMIWAPNFNQYDFNESTDAGFQFFKLLCLVPYAFQHYRGYAKEYLNKFGFKTFGQLLHSIHVITMSTLTYKKEEVLSKLTYINPLQGVDESHLKSQTINSEIGKRELTLNDIRKAPLFFNHRDKYMVIDADLYHRKTYKGPFFELYYSTELSKQQSFNQYSATISLDVLEKMLFQGIFSGLRASKYDCLHFDDNTDLSPDCYYRRNKSIFLTEFKAYLFPDELASNPDFEKIKEYIDRRFVKTEGGKAKGITQLINQINRLYANEFEFDEKFRKELHSKKVTIYPIICHNEFNFSMPGINEYLNTQFMSGLSAEVKAKFNIKSLVLINLDILYDLMLRGGTFKEVEGFLERYHRIIDSRNKQMQKQLHADNFLRAKSSFDEIYNSLFFPELKDIPKTSDITQRLRELIGVEQAQLDKEV